MNAIEYQVKMQGLIDEFITDRIILDLEYEWKWSEDCKVISKHYDDDRTIRFKVLANGLVREYLVVHDNGKIIRWKCAYMETDWGRAEWIEQI